MSTNTYNTDSIEFRFIPIREESQKDYPNFEVDKTYPGEYKMQFGVVGFSNVARELDNNLNTFKANIELVNDYEVICKKDNEYLQIGIRHIDSDTYYALVGPIRQWLEWRKNNGTKEK